MSSNFTVNKICECCGDVFQAKTTVTKYCSKACNSAHYKQKLRNKKTAPMDKLIEKVINKNSSDIAEREFLTVKMAAMLLGASEKIVYGMIASGKIRSANLSQRKTLIYRHDIDNLFILPTPSPRPEKEPGIDECYHMAEAQAKFGVSESALFNIIKRHNIKKIQSGWYTYVPKKALDQIFNPTLELCQK